MLPLVAETRLQGNRNETKLANLKDTVYFWKQIFLNRK